MAYFLLIADNSFIFRKRSTMIQFYYFIEHKKRINSKNTKQFYSRYQKIDVSNFKNRGLRTKELP